MALRSGLTPTDDSPPDPRLRTTLWGIDFPNPIGMAAGFDKNAEAFGGLMRTGFGFVETGTVTPRAQAGNPRPRLFRLTEDRAVINRLGFNNQGLDAFAARLERRKRSDGILGANIGCNKDSEDQIADYVTGYLRVATLADYVVVNISSPNTPGLRAMQAGDSLRRLIGALAEARAAVTEARPPLLVKVAPDLDHEERRTVADVALETGVDGLIVGNTTVSRPEGLRSAHRDEAGGLSGKPLFDLSTAVLADFYGLCQGRLPLIGVGGVASGRDAYAKIRAGASLVQLYTALVYGGPGLVRRIKAELAECLAADGIDHVGAAVGRDARTR